MNETDKKLRGLRDELERVQGLLDQKTQSLQAQRQHLRRLLGEKVGRLRRLCRLEAGELRAWLGTGTVVGVDGSCNLVGSGYPHYIGLLAAAARSTAGGETWAWQVWTPLTREERLGEEADEAGRRQALAALEAEVAAEAVSRFAPRLLLIDGPLVRLRIEAPEAWEVLFRQVRQTGVALVGVIESVGTSLIAPLLADDLPVSWRGAFDRELLWNLLEPGEMLVVSHPHKPGLRSCFLRTGSDPAPVGLDIPTLIPWSEEETETIADVLFTLTPEKGRGIPIWMDLVDARVRLDDQLVRGLVGGTISPENWWRFFAPKRERRPF